VNEDLTVFAHLTSSASVSECSLLDNWSYYENAATCSAPAAAVEIQEYDAACPDGTSVSWGFLVWYTTLQGSDSITFEVRASHDGSFSGPTTLLGTSALSPEDTSHCGFLSSLSECPVDVGSTLWPAGVTNQRSHLELTITLHPSGQDTPTLHDWGLTYSCRYDE
jgi:hypothetical protein